MKDILQDIVAKTHSLGFLNLVKVTGTDEATVVESMAEDRSVILTAKTKSKEQQPKANPNTKNKANAKARAKAKANAKARAKQK